MTRLWRREMAMRNTIKHSMSSLTRRMMSWWGCCNWRSIHKPKAPPSWITANPPPKPPRSNTTRSTPPKDTWSPTGTKLLPSGTRRQSTRHRSQCTPARREMTTITMKIKSRSATRQMSGQGSLKLRQYTEWMKKMNLGRRRLDNWPLRHRRNKVRISHLIYSESKTMKTKIEISSLSIRWRILPVRLSTLVATSAMKIKNMGFFLRSQMNWPSTFKTQPHQPAPITYVRQALR